MIESDLVQFLLEDEDLSALVGERVRPSKLPPSKLGLAYPAVSFFLVSSPRDHTHDAVGGMERSTFQINCWGKTYASAKAVAAAVRGRLDNFRGEMGPGETRVHAALKQDEADIPHEPGLAVGTDVVEGVRLDFLIIHND